MSYHELQLCTCLFVSRIKSCAKFEVLSWAATLQFLSEMAESKVVGEKLSRILVDRVKVVCQKTSDDYRSDNISYSNINLQFMLYKSIFATQSRTKLSQ